MKKFTIADIADEMFHYVCENTKHPTTKAAQFKGFEKGRADYMATKKREFERKMAVAEKLSAAKYFKTIGKKF